MIDRRGCDMISTIALDQLVARLGEHKIAHAVLPLDNRMTLVATTLGGRLFAFLPDRGGSLLWVNPAFGDPEAFAAFVRAKSSNIGGDRVWVGPEIQFLVQERSPRVGQSKVVVPVDMDPGMFTLASGAGTGCRLEQTMTLEAFCLARGSVMLQQRRTIRPLADPLAGTGISDGVTFAGYEQEISLRRMGGDEIHASWWSVTNLHPGGDVLFATLPAARYDDFSDTVPHELHEVGPNYVRARLTGNRRYKTGYDARHVLGRYAYLNQWSDDEGYLLVRAFYSQPGGRYLEEPAHKPGRNGHSAFVYNDGGSFGGFGEFECMGAAIGGPEGPTECLDRLPMWIYIGELAKLRVVMHALLGVDA